MAKHYEIRLQGHLDEAWINDTGTNYIGDIHIAHLPDGATQLFGTIQDQPALHGLFDRFRDLGISILFLQSITEKQYYENIQKEK